MRSPCRFLLAAVAVVAIVAVDAARADSYVVVNAANPLRSLTQKEVIDLFMGRNRVFPGGDAASPLDLPRDSPQRAAFYTALTGLTQAQINSYWARLLFAGQTAPPPAVAGEQALVEAIRRNPGAIGYLPQEPADKSLRALLVLKDRP